MDNLIFFHGERARKHRLVGDDIVVDGVIVGREREVNNIVYIL